MAREIHPWGREPHKEACENHDDVREVATGCGEVVEGHVGGGANRG